jgi:hypothetical protein
MLARSRSGDSGAGIRKCGAAALGLSVLASGCLNPNTYGTPRTTPVGEVQQTLAFEVVSYRAVSRFEGTSQSQTEAGNTPLAPTYALRYGLSETLDIGGRFGNFSSLGTDLKWNFFKTDVIDVALDPGVTSFVVFDGIGGDGANVHVYANAPLLFGINPGPELTIAPSVGLGYGLNTNEQAFNNSQEAIAATEALLLQAGLGLDFRLSSYFAIHPEMSVIRRLSGPAGSAMIWYTFGLGFSWGALPNYGLPADDLAR